MYLNIFISNLPALLKIPEAGSTVTFRREPVVNLAGWRLPWGQVARARRLHLQPRRRSVRSRALPALEAAQTACPHHRAWLSSPKLDTMSTVVSDGVFLSALQPNSSVTTYGLPSNIRLGNGSSATDEASRVHRVQQQVQMRLAEKSTLPRQNGAAMSGTANARC